MSRGKSNGSSGLKDTLRRIKVKLSLILVLMGIGLSAFFMLSWDWLSILAFSVGVGEKAPYDIVAHKDVEIIDEEETQKLKERVASRIRGVFIADERVVEEVLAKVKERLSGLEELLPEQRDHILKVLEEGYSKGISQESLPALLEGILKRASEITLHEDVITKLKDILEAELKPNVRLDETETEKQRLLAVREVRPVTLRVHRGETVVRKGEPLKREHILILEALGFSKSKITLKLIGILIVSLLLIWIIYIYLAIWYSKGFEDIGLLLFIFFSVSLLFFLGRILTPVFPTLVPIGIVPLSYAVLICPRFAIFMTWILAFALSFFKGAGFAPLVLGIFGGIAGIKELRGIRHRGSFIRAGVIMGVVNGIALTAIGLFLNIPTRVMLLNGFLGFLNGVGSSIVVAGGLPYVESLFGLFSPLRLLELADPSHPLLRRLQVEAPGTYHHSLLVANLAEAAADEIGADALLARVGSYYHDIGKLKRPHLFIENQVDEKNYHEKITPHLSLLVVTSHVKDGLELAREYKLPQPVVDIILQHHGTSVVSYFYHKAKEEMGDAVNPDDFRYPGPKPQTKEAAIVMLADCVEASARLLTELTPSKLEGLVREAIKMKVEDGQLNESPLSFRDLERIVYTFVKVLRGMYHSRIEYPEGGKNGESSNKRSREASKEGGINPEGDKRDNAHGGREGV